ncbi:MAG: ATP/GTP-binding protein [Methylococcaceae bacterium]
MNAQQKLKLVFTGSVGAGKTNAISQISEVPVILTEVKPTRDTLKEGKLTTTVAMDYGELTLNEKRKLHLYGTPGQKRFDFMSEILCEGALGLIILIDNSQTNPLEDLNYYLNLNSTFLKKNPAVIGITHTDKSTYPAQQDYEQSLKETGKKFPIVNVDARIRRDVLLLLSTLVEQLDQRHSSQVMAY